MVSHRFFKFHMFTADGTHLILPVVDLFKFLVQSLSLIHILGERSRSLRILSNLQLASSSLFPFKLGSGIFCGYE